MPGELPKELPSEMRLRPSPLKWIGVSGIGILFAAIGVWMIVSEGKPIGWFCALFFGLVGVTGVMQLCFSSLKLDLDGFEETALGRKKKFRWVEVSQFGTWRVSGNELVCFNSAKDVGAMASVNRSIAGATQSLGDTYSKSAAELAAIMNGFRHRALSKLAEKFEESPLSHDPN